MVKRTRFSPEVRERAVRMVYEHASEHPSEWAAITSIASKIGRSAQTLSTWIKRRAVDRGQRPGVSTEEPALRAAHAGGDGPPAIPSNMS
jgi:transposase